MTKLFRYTMWLLPALSVVLSACGPTPQDELRQAIGQKLMLDFRYYCTSEPVADAPCRQPMTTLPSALFRLIEDTSLGGVILFKENLDTPEQIIHLTYDLQRAALRSAAWMPMFIAIDQEGGRVFRTPRHLTTAFSGSMAIGATAAQYGNHFATITGDIIASELNALGINTNFSPTVDVNVNPRNPVINTRAFGEDPMQVSQLASAQLSAMQQQNVLGTLKHFPGHGDTHIDSHTGLPLVTHDLAAIRAVDLLPFQEIINRDSPAMIMTAHIQYPALDNSTLPGLDGQLQIRPATLSRTILTDLLRHEMGYSGLIVTDALDMAGISHFFNPTQAVIETFKAGADIAVMPLRLHHKSELVQLEQLIGQVVQAVERGELSRTEIMASAARIRAIKQQYELNTSLIHDKTAAIAKAGKILGSAGHRKQEQALADASLTVVRGRHLLPLPETVKHLQLFMPDRRICLALQQALTVEKPELHTACTSMLHYSETLAAQQTAQADAIVIGSLDPAPSAVELGGMEDLTAISSAALSHAEVQQHIPAIIATSRQLSKPVYFVSLRAPYDIPLLAEHADAVLATYGNDLYQLPGSDPTSDPTQPVLKGLAYTSLARAFSGSLQPGGRLPVTLKAADDSTAAVSANMEKTIP
ncbi:glycoside hydrolase family 3 protein [Chromatiaceae bacterium AAb-1]|nr:glycoside hydrolase family 3 protein [Chromatiaceae bacterium AAb-1]